MSAEEDTRPRCRRTGGKVIFASSAEAEAELARAQERRARGVSRREDPHTEVRAYPCIRCGGHHLTSAEEAPDARAFRGKRRRPSGRGR